MDRLIARTAHIDDVGYYGGFVATASVDEWVAFLGSIVPSTNPLQVMPPLQRRNLGYRLQLMEFDCALLLLDRESTAPFYSTLHGSVRSMKIQQICVLAHSILEGVGAHLWRAGQTAANLPVNPANKVRVTLWQPALVADVMGSQNPPQTTAAALSAQLAGITGWRDRVHMDRFEPNDGLHFNEFTYAAAFDPTYRTFRMALSAIAQPWPDTCLNEVI
ncbi:hypothetical protein [Mesorhizobium muleiense]|uniref:hypothetical protein n=1 Tax=Mesorhizobium muleiense TaxID=1004279 RepID=UPI001F47531C|nr:hypothetical protein [Mesorhizobium muleiense]MCF6112214.1 hypothetical protein [Mesorhizobium muleiense]